MGDWEIRKLNDANVNLLSSDHWKARGDGRMDGPPQVTTAPPEVILPCGQAWNRMEAALFPVNLGKWLTLGFVAWLAMLAPVHGALRCVHFTLKGDRPWWHPGWQRESPEAWEMWTTAGASCCATFRWSSSAAFFVRALTSSRFT